MFAVSIENVGATIGRPLGADVNLHLRASNARPYIQIRSISRIERAQGMADVHRGS